MTDPVPDFDRHSLADLDDRALPVVAAALRAIGHGFRAIVGPEGAIGRHAAPWIRREPVIAVAVLCVAFAAILIAATGGDNEGPVRPPSHVGPKLTGAHLLGPAAGAQVSAYASTAAQRRSSLNELASSQPLIAVVDFNSYLTAQAIDQVLNGTPGLEVVRGFAKVPPPRQADVHVLLPSTGVDLSAGLTAAQQAAGQFALHYEHELSRSITHPSARLTTKVAADAARAQAARTDAAGLGPTCGCVFSIVVSGPVGQLERLAQQDAVRILDPAPVAASLSSLMVVPLEPEVTDAVPPLSFAGE